METLNEVQSNIIKIIDEPVLVAAVAGSGKTRLLINRIAYLIKERNVSPKNILAITFTNKAADEMKKRILKMQIDTEGIWVSTFHSMCAKILHSHIINLKKDKPEEKTFDNNFSIYTESDSKKVLKDVCAKFNITDDRFIKTAGWKISDAKNNNLTPWQYQVQHKDEQDIELYTKVYNAYQNALKSNNALDFDDLLTKTYELFDTRPDILNYYQNRFLYIHVDEFQDTNIVQYEIVKQLAGKNKNIFVVGDEDQCIYGWRGANYENVNSFLKDFKAAYITNPQIMGQNYRSGENILKAASSLIRNNTNRTEKNLWAEDKGGIVHTPFSGRNEYDEAEYVVSTVYNLVNYKGFKYNDIAVLVRLNALTRAFEEKFLNYNIPYVIFGGQKFFERLEVKNILAYLRILVNPQDSASLFRVINYPKRNIGETTVQAITEIAETHNTSPLEIIINSDEYMLSDALAKKTSGFKEIYLDLLESCKELPPEELMPYLIKKTKIKEQYDPKNEEDLGRLANIDELVNSALHYFEENKGGSLGDYINSISLIADIDTYDDKNNAVVLATVHAVKGLEFNVVFIVGLEQGGFPIIRDNNIRDIEEERRLMYVAITRAKKQLYLTNAQSRMLHGERKYTQPSQFLEEIDESRAAEQKTATAAQAYNFKEYQGGKVSFNLPKTAAEGPKADMSKFAAGNIVEHARYGRGKITHTDAASHCIIVDFDSVGTKSLSVDYAPIKLVDS